jgi:protein-S-isoprenylcysteine O-methyltransferase Ste14
MSSTSYLLASLGYLTMYALPHLFFRGDAEHRFNLRWWITSLPFATAPVALILSYLGRAPALLAADTGAARVLELMAVPLLAGALALIAATVASHRVPLALWHQHDDAPRSIVTHGPYRWVRHPFYVSFLLLLAGSAMITRDVIALGSFGLGLAILTWTARREEQRLATSAFGADYVSYLGRTGRFVPRLGR